MPDETVGEVRLRDPLSDVTRQERKYLLGISFIAITIVKAGIIPTKVPALGVEFGKTDQQSLLWAVGLITAYFLIAFVVYASSDFLVWRLAFRCAFRKHVQERLETSQKKDPTYSAVKNHEKWFFSRWFNKIILIFSRPVSFVRALFEFLFPILIGVYTIILVWTAPLPIDGS